MIVLLSSLVEKRIGSSGWKNTQVTAAMCASMVARFCLV